VKTISLKKVSAVAVASLGFGLLSVVPANAANVTVALTSINLTTVTSSPKTNEVVKVNLGFVMPTQSITGLGTDDRVRFQAALTTYPVGGSTSVTGVILTAAGAAVATVPGLTGTSVSISGGAVELSTTAGANALDTIGHEAAGGVTTITSSSTVGAASYSFTPTKAGTYTLTVWHDAGATPNGELSTAEVRQTVDIVVTAASSYSNALSTAHSISTAGTDAATSTTDLVTLIASKTMSTATRASITISIKNSSNGAMTTGNTITATMSGSGGVVATAAGLNADVPSATDCSATTVTRTVTGAADAINTISLCSDGTAGKGTVTISVTDTSGATQVLATKTITFFGDAAKLTVTSQPFKVLAAGGATSGVKTGITGTALATQPAFAVQVTDAGGNPVSGLTGSLSGVSADTTQVSAVSNNEATAGNDATGIYKGLGTYVFDATTPSSAKSSATPTVVTIRMVDPADSTKYLTTTVSFTVGDLATAVTIATDKTSYAAGDQGTLTLTAKDASGNPIADGSVNLLGSTGLTASKGVQGSLPTSAAVETKSGVKTYTFFAPVSGGAFSINGTIGTAAATASRGAAITTSSSVIDGNAALLTQIDALNAKIVALNALIAKIMKKLGVK